MILSPNEIEARSMAIIAQELPAPLPEETRDITMRVIHTTADLSFASSLRFRPGVVIRMRALLMQGAAIVTDTNMALAGINKAAAAKLKVPLLCEMAEPEVGRMARERGVTRAWILAERAWRMEGDVLFACGNAPTALIRLCQLAEEGRRGRFAVIGAPVGFVNVVEAKEMLWNSSLDCIAAMGRRGGSNVAAAIVNALMYGIEGVRTCG